MKDAIRRIVAVWMAACVAISVLLAPANATAMIGCGEHQPSVHAHDAEPSQDLHVQTTDHGADAHEPPEGHCANHSCIIAMGAMRGTPYAAQDWLIADLKALDRALLALARPDGLLRPPRI